MKSTPTSPKTKLGPGEYKPDIAFERIEDLPRAKLIKQSRNYAHRACPRCGKSAFRDRIFVRHLHDVGDLVSEFVKITCLSSHSGTIAFEG